MLASKPEGTQEKSQKISACHCTKGNPSCRKRYQKSMNATSESVWHIWVCETESEAVWQIRKFLYVCKHLITFTWDLAQTHLSTACAPPGKSPAWTRAGRPRRRTRRSATGGRPGGGRWLLATASQSKPHPLLPHRGSWQPILWE